MSKLVIKRKVNQKVRINSDIFITVLNTSGGSASLLIEAPEDHLVTIVKDHVGLKFATESSLAVNSAKEEVKEKSSRESKAKSSKASPAKIAEADDNSKGLAVKPKTYETTEDGKKRRRKRRA